MFTGIVEEVGSIGTERTAGGTVRLSVEASPEFVAGLALGDSVALSGCCLTVVAMGPDTQPATFDVELTSETVAKTAPRWRLGERVNLERAVVAGGRLGGHLVAGHVDGVGQVLKVVEEPGRHEVFIRAPRKLAGYLVTKGSITVDGVSLTLVEVGGPAGTSKDMASTDFSIALIPHTLAVTTLDELRPGSKVNLEGDILAKHVERLLALRDEGA
ncbi:MAG TPA: riboflavin synthase [Trueperaceae bacterium]|nr:riboflavin synthase [Trueperaceae bacterium]